MIVWNILRKIILVPIVIVLTLVEWCGTFLTGIIYYAINLIALLLFLVAGLSSLLGIASGAEVLRIVVVALGAVIVNNLLIIVVGSIKVARRILTEYL